MSSKKAPRLLSLAMNYQIGFLHMVKLLEELGFDKDNLRATSFATPEIIEAIELHHKKQKSENKISDDTRINKIEISDNNIDLNEFLKINVDLLSGPKIIGKIKLPVNDFSSDDFQKNTTIPSQNKYIYHAIETEKDLGLAIGVINFFDYYKNNFGIIEKIVTEKNKQIREARVVRDGLKIKRRLNKGDVVVFQLNYFNKYIATDVDIIDNISIENLVSLLNVIDDKHLVKLVTNISDSVLENIGEENRLDILNKIITIADTKIWKLVLRINSPEFIKKYVLEIINSFSDEVKLSYLWESSNEILFDNIIQNWNSTNSDSLSSLLNFINKKNISYLDNSSNLIFSINNSDLSYDCLLGYNKILKTDDFRNELINKFSFISNSSLSDLLFLNDLMKFKFDEISVIKETLKLESSSLSFSKLFSIYKELNIFNLIPTYDDLISLLKDKQLTMYELFEFIKPIPNNYISNEIICILSNSINNIDKWECNEIIDEIKLQSKVGKQIVDIILNKEENIDSWKLLNIIKTKSNSKLVNKYFLDKYSHELADYDIFETLKLAITNDSKKAQEESYRQITESKKYDISSENDLLIILNNLTTLEIPARVKELNKPFSEFVSYLQKTNDFFLNQELRGFLKECSGATQTMVVKYLIYQFHKKNITTNKLIEILNSFNWTEISALLIVEFIKEKNYSGKILVEKLDVVFKNHFLTISSNNYDSDNFLKNFQIGSIIGKCNGRKHYDGSNWQNKRWYFKNGNVTYTTNRRDEYCQDFFCEGRPWKIQEVWNSDTGKDTGKKIDLYWCKTRSCASRNDSVDTNKPFYSWTISDISQVMGIAIEKLALAYLAGWANRMNQIVEHLFCRECNEVLRPLPFVPHTLGYYAVPVFNCVNSVCTEYEKRIRFTHCMDGKCKSHLSNEPLDSRDCKSCNKNDPFHTGLLCKHCGQPCPKCFGGYKPVYAENRF